MIDSRPRLVETHRSVWEFHTWQNIGIVLWHGASDREAAEQIGDVTAEFRDQQRSLYSFIHVVRASTGLADRETREVLAQRIDDHGEGLVLMGIVIEGEGFRASALRSLVTSILWLRPSAPYAVKGNIESICERVVQDHARRGNRLDQAALLEALRAVLASERKTTTPGVPG